MKRGGMIRPHLAAQKSGRTMGVAEMKNNETMALFKKWCQIKTCEGGKCLTPDSANSYCAYLQQCPMLNASIFVPNTDHLLDPIDLQNCLEKVKDLRESLTEQQIEVKSLNNIKAALKKYCAFLLWLSKNRPVWTCAQIDVHLDEINSVNLDADEAQHNERSETKDMKNANGTVEVGNLDFLTEGKLKAYLVGHFHSWKPVAQDVMARSRAVCERSHVGLDDLVRTVDVAKSSLANIATLFADKGANGISTLRTAVRHCCMAKHNVWLD